MIDMPGKRGMTGKHGNQCTGRRVEYVAITCEVCGVVREYTPSEVRRRGAIRFCSYACSGRASAMPERYVEFACAQCGRVARKRRDHLHERNFCSPSCVTTARRVDGARWRDPDQIKTYMAGYTAANRERLNAQKQAYKKAHRDVANAIQRARRARAAVSAFTVADWEAVKARFGNRCLACGVSGADVSLEPDHVVPLARGGSHTAANIQPLCRRCNARKGAKTVDYRAIHGIDIVET